MNIAYKPKIVNGKEQGTNGNNTRKIDRKER